MTQGVQPASGLRHKMVHFLQNFQYCIRSFLCFVCLVLAFLLSLLLSCLLNIKLTVSDMMVEVLEPNWHKFEVAFRKVRTVDEVLKIHSDFVDSCLNECMLTDPNLVKVFILPSPSLIFA